MPPEAYERSPLIVTGSNNKLQGLKVLVIDDSMITGMDRNTLLCLMSEQV